MKTININLGKRSYPIYVGEELLENNELRDKYSVNGRITVDPIFDYNQIYDDS